MFLDRDGVLNEVMMRDGAPVAPLTAADFRVVPGAREAVERLHAAGYPVFVATNQPDVVRGMLPQAELDAMHAKLRAAVPVDGIAFCPHDDAARCHCRKPKAGMLTDLARAHGLDLSRSVMVGDTWKDMGAGRAAGCLTILLRREYNADVKTADVVADTLAEAVDHILELRSGPVHVVQ